MATLMLTPAHGASSRPSPSSLTHLTATDGMKLDLRYASTRNFTGRVIEDGPNGFDLHTIAAQKLLNAVSILGQTRPGWALVVFDGLRTKREQGVLWEVVKGTDRQRFVADPRVGSIHSYGFAVDVSLLDDTGRELDMGTPFDDFSPRSEPRLEPMLLASGQLTRGQVANRRFLRQVMSRAGFLPLAIEWWHFDALPPQIVRANYTVVP